MKKIFRITFALAAIAAIASCAEDINNPEVGPDKDNTGATSSVEFVRMTFSTGANEDVESKTTYEGGRKVLWEGADEISVFSAGSESVNSKGIVSEIADDRTSVRFDALADPAADSYYAVYPYSDANACDAEGNLTVTIPSVQTAVGGGFMSGANTSVAYSQQGAEGNVLQFKNIAALVCISFDTDADAAATKSITIKAKKNDTEYWGLAGNGKVSFDDNMEPVLEEEGDVQSVTLEAPEGGFVSGEVVYYIPVYAVGAITGLEVTYLGQDDMEYVKTNSLASTLKRNVLFNIGAIPYPYDTLPSTITLTLDFTQGWPFNEKIAGKGEQSLYVPQMSFGESYTYTYSYKYPDREDGRDMETTFDFNIAKGTVDTTAYRYFDKQYLSLGHAGGDNAGNIVFPGIEGRYLTEVRVDKFDYSNDRVAIVDSEADTRTSAAFTGNNNKNDYYWIFTLYSDKCETYSCRTSEKWEYSTAVKAELGKRYEIRAFNNATKNNNVKIKSVILTYKKTKPGNAPTTAAE